MFSRKNWKVRWFDLEDGQLSYRKGKGGATLGVIHVREIISIHAGRVNNASGFSICTQVRTYYIVSKTEREATVSAFSSVLCAALTICCLAGLAEEHQEGTPGVPAQAHLSCVIWILIRKVVLSS